MVGEECARAKPHPDPYLDAAKLIGLGLDEVFAVEDSPSGTQLPELELRMFHSGPETLHAVVHSCGGAAVVPAHADNNAVRVRLTSTARQLDVTAVLPSPGTQV